jgi:hypothetical protein
MKFCLAIEKKNRNNIGTVQGHNNRLHETRSQLPKEAWITPKGHHVLSEFNADLLAESKGLAKRKDAVLAVELVLQVGNQTDWRDLPTEEHPHGKRKSGASEKLNKLIAGVKAAALAEFGKDRIISIDLHTDESTPHIHVVFAPIKDGKLQAKAWLDGPASIVALRERMHAHVNKFIECSYEKGPGGGEPYDREKAAGGPKGPQPAAGFLQRASEAITSSKEIKTLRDAVTKLQGQLQAAFSRQKSAELKAAAAAKEAEDAARRVLAAERETRKAKKDSDELKTIIETLKTRIDAQTQVRRVNVPMALKNAPTPR